MSFTGWWLGHPSEKYEFVNWDDEIPNIWENKKCSRPPTSLITNHYQCCPRRESAEPATGKPFIFIYRKQFTYWLWNKGGTFPVTSQLLVRGPVWSMRIRCRASHATSMSFPTSGLRLFYFPHSQRLSCQTTKSNFHLGQGPRWLWPWGFPARQSQCAIFCALVFRFAWPKRELCTLLTWLNNSGHHWAGPARSTGLFDRPVWRCPKNHWIRNA